MKRSTITILTLLSVFLAITACDKDHAGTLTYEDQLALNGMKEAYDNAIVANNFLEKSLQAGDSAGIHMYDSTFHQCLDNFKQQHSIYRHRGPHDDHLHNGQTMNGMGGMMGNFQPWSGGHHVSEHGLMDQLVKNHETMAH